jgi:glutathione S-transferase
MEELGLKYDLKEFKRNADMSASDEFKAATPLGRSPTITDGDVTLFESGAILEYIIHKYGNGKFAVSPDSADYPFYIEWMHGAEGTVMPQLLQSYLLKRAGIEESSPLMKRALEGRDTLLSYIDSQLATRAYIGGEEFSAADIMMSYPLQVLGMMKTDIGGYTHLQEYKKLITSRPAFPKS